jgi:hypothetical protein
MQYKTSRSPKFVPSSFVRRITMLNSRLATPACGVCCRWGGIGGVVLCAGLLAWFAGRSGQAAQDQPASPQKAALPPDLERVPADAALLVSARVADVWNSDPVQGLRQRMAQELAEGVKAFQKEVGVEPGEMERATLVVTNFKAEGPIFFITTIKPYDRAKILATVLPGVKAEKRMEQVFFVSDNHRAIFFINDRTYLVATPEGVRAYLDHPAAREGALRGALQLATEKHQLVGGFNIAAFAREFGDKLPPEMDAFKDLLKARAATWTVDLGEQNRADLRLHFASDAEAKQAEKPVRAAIDLIRTELVEGMKQMSRAAENGGKLTHLFKLADLALRTASVAQKGPQLEVTLSVKADTATLVSSLIEGVRQMRESASRMQSVNNLKQIALAMHNYHATYNHFPPQAIYSKEGKPLLSWRVLLLPYLEQDGLYRQFKLDESWDSPHNKKLLAQMPKVYADPNVHTTQPVTVYQAFVGPGAFFEGKKGLSLGADFPDGTSNTLMVVEATNPVPWTSPDDLPYDPNKPLPKLGGHIDKRFAAAYCDGSVRLLNQNIKESVLRALITRNGGELIDPKDEF